MLKRHLVTLAILILLAAMTLPLPAPVTAQIPVVLWYSWTGTAENMLLDWVAGYQERTPSIAIQAEFVPLYQLRQQFIDTPNSERPDIFFAPSDWGGDLYANALTAPLDVRLTAVQRQQIAEVAWATLAYNEKTVGIPLALEGLTLYYNRALLGSDDVPATWADLLDQAAAVKGTLGLVIGAGFYPTAGIYGAYGGELVDQRGSNLMNSELSLTQYLSRVKELYDRSGGTIQIGGAGGDFRDGKSIFAVDGSWQFALYRSKLGENLGVAALPPVDGIAWRPLIRTTALYVSASSRQIDAALSFARFVTSAEEQKKMVAALLLPANPSVTVDDEQLAVISKQLLDHGIPISTRPEMLTYWRALQQAIDDVAIRGVAPAQAAADLVAQFNPATPVPEASATP
ncbi:MAG: extracellular solute-binding protein [Anaerolineae bacterium]|nr:extracellular solute-binding protein [Anaerolineae bacterium]